MFAFYAVTKLLFMIFLAAVVLFQRFSASKVVYACVILALIAGLAAGYLPEYEGIFCPIIFAIVLIGIIADIIFLIRKNK